MANTDYSTDPAGFHAGIELRDGSTVDRITGKSYSDEVVLVNGGTLANETKAVYFEEQAIDPYERLYANVVYT